MENKDGLAVNIFSMEFECNADDDVIFVRCSIFAASDESELMFFFHRLFVVIASDFGAVVVAVLSIVFRITPESFAFARR